MAPVVQQNIIVPLGSVANVDAAMSLATLTEVVNVTAQTSNALVVPTGQTNLTSRELNTIPVGRTPARIAEFAPGLTDNTPNIGQVTISGGFAYDNVFMIDGVDLNDNLFGTANNVFIEDAIDETQVLTSGISAEYGRFSGGVINMVTKRGGNTFSGSVRLNFSNPAWANESPLEKSRGTTHPDTLSKFLEGTFGGPILRDRIWFFFAGRRERSSLNNADCADGDSVGIADHQRPIRDQDHGHAPDQPHHPGQLRRQLDRAGQPRQHQRGSLARHDRAGHRAAAEQAVRHQLQWRDRVAAVRDAASTPRRSSASAMRVAPARPWRTRRFAPAVWLLARPTGSTITHRSSLRWIPRIATIAVRRQRQLLPHDAKHRQPQPQGRRRALHVEPPWAATRRAPPTTSSSPTI